MLVVCFLNGGHQHEFKDLDVINGKFKQFHTLRDFNVNLFKRLAAYVRAESWSCPRCKTKSIQP